VNAPVTRYNPHTGMAYTVKPSPIPFALDVDECALCDGFGRIWNNADPSSGQFFDCECGK